MTKVWVYTAILVAIIIACGVFLFTNPSPVETQTPKLSPPSSQSEMASTIRPPQSQSQTVNDITSSADTGIDIWVLISFLALSTATLIATSISFYLYRWRKILLSNTQLAVPEQLGEWVGSINSEMNSLGKTVANAVTGLTQQAETSSQKVTDLTDTFITMQQALDERDNEIRRLKRGYDTEIFRKFLNRFIRVSQFIEDIKTSDQISHHDVEQLSSVLDDAFQECNVEKFHPEIGSDFRKAVGVADNPKSVKTDNPDNSFKIIEILECGYHLVSPEGNEVLIPSKVKIQMN